MSDARKRMFVYIVTVPHESSGDEGRQDHDQKTVIRNKVTAIWSSFLPPHSAILLLASAFDSSTVFT